MEFDVERFTSAALHAREEDVPVKELAEFFGGGKGKDRDRDQIPVWRVRGVTAAQLAVANEAGARTKNLTSIVEALAAGNDVGGQVKELLGLGAAVPDDVARRLSLLVSGSVVPTIEHETAVRLSEHYPTVFYHLTNRILSLTGAGAEVGKRRRSGGGRTSEDASPSAT